MYSKFIVAGILLLVSASGYAQYIVRGTVVSQQDNTPIPFANIGIINSTVGTCGYEAGSFKLMVPKNMINQPVTFSAIGYSNVQYNIDPLKLDKVVVSLKENTTVLQEIQIRPDQEINSDFVGQESPGIFSRWGEALASADGGSAWATKIRDQEGWISIDFSPYHVSLSQDFYLVFEWIMDKKGAQLAAEHEANSLPWKLPNSDIWNNNLMVYLNENGDLVKQKLTKSQQQDCKEREFPQTWFGIKKTKTRGTNFSRKASMAPWIEQPAFDLVVNVEYEYF